jgi:hypothetical protein
LADRYVLAGDVLISWVSENHRRSMRPIVAAMSGGILPEAQAVVPSRRAVGRAIRGAVAAADLLVERMRRDRVRFLPEWWVQHRFVYSARAMVHAEVAVQELRPSVVVAGTNHGPEARALTLYARRAGVPSVYVPHAPMLEYTRLRDLPFDYACLRGEQERAWYEREHPGGSARIFATGNPSLNPDAKPVGPLDGAIVLALSPDEAPTVRAIVAATESAAAGREIVVAPHPRQDLALLREIVPNHWRLHQGRTYELLRTSRPAALVQFSSGVALEALMLGIPTLEYSPFGAPPAYPFLDDPVVPRASTPADLRRLLDEVSTSGGSAAGTCARLEWASSWCAASGTSAAELSRDAILRARSGGPGGWIWDAWAPVVCPPTPAVRKRT